MGDRDEHGDRALEGLRWSSRPGRTSRRSSTRSSVFGDEFDYLVTAYPPFLKHVVDALDERGFDWERTRVYGAVGGEGMTEAMRDYLERRLVKVRSGYGASDIQVGIAGETDLSVWVRKLLVERTDVREALLGPGEDAYPDGVPVQPARELHRGQRAPATPS